MKKVFGFNGGDTAGLQNDFSRDRAGTGQAGLYRRCQEIS